MDRCRLKQVLLLIVVYLKNILKLVSCSCILQAFFILISKVVMPILSANCTLSKLWVIIHKSDTERNVLLLQKLGDVIIKPLIIPLNTIFPQNDCFFLCRRKAALRLNEDSFAKEAVVCQTAISFIAQSGRCVADKAGKRRNKKDDLVVMTVQCCPGGLYLRCSENS